MTELKIRGGDYVADGVGGTVRVKGRDALLQRVLFRLTARRGGFRFWRIWAAHCTRWEANRLPTGKARRKRRLHRRWRRNKTCVWSRWNWTEISWRCG